MKRRIDTFWASAAGPCKGTYGMEPEATTDDIMENERRVKYRRLLNDGQRKKRVKDKRPGCFMSFNVFFRKASKR